MFRDLSLNFALVSSEELHIRHSESPRFSGAAAVAQILGPMSQRLSELLSSGSARNLNEAIHQLNPSEQNQLRERWGRSLDELISLSNERDSAIFHHGLLEVGHRLEAADQVELASVVYSALVAGNSPRPPLSTRAQARLNAIHGVGDWRARWAFNLERLPSNVTRWDMLLAMSGAGLVFRGVRLAATARWASSVESAFALNAAATSTAFLSETLAFTGLGRLFGTMAGNHYDWSATGTFNEWAGGAAMLLGLKAMGGIFGNLSEGWAAGETAFARVTRAVTPQAGMFSGIVLGNRLAELGGFHPERHGDTWLVDGLTTLLEFNIAGRLQGRVGGPGLTNLEGRMEAYRRDLGSGGRGRWADLFSSSGLSPEGILLRVPPKSSSGERALQETTVLSVSDEGNGSNGNGPPGSRPKDNSSLSTLPFGVPVESLRDPSRAMFSQDLLRRMSDPEYGFAEQLRNNKNLDLTLDNVLSNPDFFAKSVVETLDRLGDIEDLARVNILLPRSSERMVFRKFQGTWRYTGMFPEGAPVESTAVAPTEITDPKSPATLSVTAPVAPVLETPPVETTPTPTSPPKSVGEGAADSGREPTSPFLRAVRMLGGAASGETPPPAREAPEFRWVSTTTAFSNHVEELFNPEFETNPMVIFMDRGTALAARDIRTLGERLERALLTSVIKSRRMLVHDLRGKKTFQFALGSEKVDVTVEAWRRPENLSTLQARDILDAIQQVSYLTGLKYSPEQSLRIEGLGTRWEKRDVRSLTQYLDRWTLFPYGRIDLILGGLTPGSHALSRDSQSGKWRVEP